MRAVVQRGYGDPDAVLSLGQVTPPSVAPDEVRVRARAASVHPDIWHVVTGRPYALRLMGSGLRRPTRVVPGTDMAGIVDVVGERVTRFSPGDEVFGDLAQEAPQASDRASPRTAISDAPVHLAPVQGPSLPPRQRSGARG